MLVCDVCLLAIQQFAFKGGNGGAGGASMAGEYHNLVFAVLLLCFGGLVGP